MKKMKKLTARTATLACSHPSAGVARSRSRRITFPLWTHNGIQLVSCARSASSLLPTETSLKTTVFRTARLTSTRCEDPYARDAISPFLGVALQLCFANFTQSISYARSAWNNLTKAPSRRTERNLIVTNVLTDFSDKRRLNELNRNHVPCDDFEKSQLVARNRVCLQGDNITNRIEKK